VTSTVEKKSQTGAAFDPARAAARSAERAVDRDIHLAQYLPAERPAGTATAVDLDDPTVRSYAATMTTLPADEVAARARTLAEFSAFVAESPAEMIERIFDRGSYRYVRRGYYQQKILDFSAGAEGAWEERTAVGDVIREFFRANGHTIAPAVPQWHLWLRMG
jgi:hypothetical protein